MRVLLLAEWLHQLGGCETFLVELCRGLVAEGVDASVFVAAPPVHERWRQALGERLVVAEEGVDPLEALRALSSRHRPELIHAIPLERTAFRLAALSDRPLLIGTEPSDGSERCHWATYGPAMAEALPRFAAVHAFSSRAPDNLARCFGFRGVSTVLPPLAAFPEERPLWCRRRPTGRLVGWGRLSVEKGWSFVVESLAVLRRRLGPLELDLWGGGPLEPVLAELVASCGERGRVRLLGPYPDPFALDLDGYDAALVPSFFEGLPYAFLEAMWRGLPAVVTRISGAPDLVSDPDLCRFIDPGDQEQLASALEELYGDFETQADHAAARRAVVREACSPPAVVPAMVDLYRRVLQPQSPPPVSLRAGGCDIDRAP
ncbi:MAG: glycosyltransferase family 4 protein [Acidobacteria bacterium]|nr:glycosyltransferase family 4 protein [Acidobacteriota bacterium]